MDTAAESVNGTPLVLFNNGENYITDAVLTQLNAAAPVETNPPAESAFLFNFVHNGFSAGGP